nr:prostaglandin reductase-3 isoform X3 [Parasteatoda tepidariorum]XP_042896457.1 prostaglandin reductase-3 isoform X4 [Parasteatoda tepidariorum]
MGEVVDVGAKVTELTYGKPVMFQKMGAYSEYVYASEKEVIPTASCDVNLLPLLVSGSTAALSLDKCGQIIPGDKVLITAAAGGAGHIAVQWAKNAGCHVVGLCSSQNKVQFLKNIGCDRPINYKEESIAEVLRKEYKNGLNVIWETIGGETFDLLFKNLAPKGRLVIVGATSKYVDQSLKQEVDQNMPIKLMLRSTSLNGFFLPYYKKDIPHYLNLLIRQMHEQKLTLRVDDGSQTGKQFNGLEDISRAVDHLYSGKSIGKVVVPFQ